MSSYGSYNDGPSFGHIIGIGFIIIVLFISGMRSCSSQGVTKNWGGSMTLELEPNDKLIEITWKDDNLWVLTKQMKEEDVAESYRFYEKDVTGWLEGEVIIHEIKLSEDELKLYNEQKVLEQDYNNSSNYVYNEETGDTDIVYIKYDENTNKYIKIKDYTYDEYGNLIQN